MLLTVEKCVKLWFEKKVTLFVLMLYFPVNNFTVILGYFLGRISNNL